MLGEGLTRSRGRSMSRGERKGWGRPPCLVLPAAPERPWCGGCTEGGSSLSGRGHSCQLSGKERVKTLQAGEVAQARAQRLEAVQGCKRAAEWESHRSGLGSTASAQALNPHDAGPRVGALSCNPSREAKRAQGGRGGTGINAQPLSGRGGKEEGPRMSSENRSPR